MRAIDADALMQRLGITDMDCHKCAWADKPRTICKRGGDFEDACIAIENAPTIEERKKGKWINGFCSECGEEAVTEWNDCGGELLLTRFCPECGADMRGKGND